MTKGLHKNSLRKGDNPHQWMIDDARMELIQQIKAEVERQMETARKTRINGNTQQAKEADAVIHALRILESRLDTLQEPKEQPFKVGDKVAIVEDRKIYKRGVIEKIGTNKNGTPRVIVSTETSSSWIGHPDLLVFDTLQEQPVRPSVEDAMKELDEKIAKVKKAGSWKNPELLNEMRDEQSICNGSEECEEILDNEIFDWLYNNDCRGWDKYGNIYVSKTDLRNLVKHFINTYHSNQEQPVCEDVDEEIYKEKAKVALSFGGVTGEQDRILIGFARHFYELGKQSECVKVKAESSIDRFILENCTHCTIEHCLGMRECYTSSNKQLQ